MHEPLYFLLMHQTIALNRARKQDIGATANRGVTVEPFLPGRPRGAPLAIALVISMLITLPDKSGQRQGGLFFRGSMVDAQDFLCFVQAVADGVDVDGELVGDGLG